MNLTYYLKHMDDECAILLFHENSGSLIRAKVTAPRFAPFLGSADSDKLAEWWEGRAVPASRKMLMQALRKAGFSNPHQYLLKNLALSLTDTYWVCPADADLRWADINLYDHANFASFEIPFHNATSYDPGASLGGQMEKYWDLRGGTPILVKTSTGYHFQQSVNELFATKLHTLQDAGFPFVQYEISGSSRMSRQSLCCSFTSPDKEFIPAYEIYHSKSKDSSTSPYEHYIETCNEQGVSEQDMLRRFLDYQTLTDFILSNTDRHLNNFGLLRDPKSMNLIGPAPLFDFGNSMYYNLDWERPLSRAELLETDIAGFYKREETLLKNVRHKGIIRSELLPSTSDVLDFYTSAGIPEEKATFISKNYQLKCDMLRDFQRGITISLYNEQQRLRQSSKKEFRH